VWQDRNGTCIKPFHACGHRPCHLIKAAKPIKPAPPELPALGSNAEQSFSVGPRVSCVLCGGSDTQWLLPVIAEAIAALPNDVEIIAVSVDSAPPGLDGRVAWVRAGGEATREDIRALGLGRSTGDVTWFQDPTGLMDWSHLSGFARRAGSPPSVRDWPLELRGRGIACPDRP
jgi:hypothetical protein